MQQLIDANLWDEASGIYVNKVPDGGFYRRVSPTSFYAMQTAGPSNERVDTMMKEWMMNPKHFCVTENGDFKGNADACYWGLPSIEASDAAFPTLGYWRGYVWGPMAQLTFWGPSESIYWVFTENQTAREYCGGVLCPSIAVLVE